MACSCSLCCILHICAVVEGYAASWWTVVVHYAVYRMDCGGMCANTVLYSDGLLLGLCCMLMAYGCIAMLYADGLWLFTMLYTVWTVVACVQIQYCIVMDCCWGLCCMLMAYGCIAMLYADGLWLFAMFVHYGFSLLLYAVLYNDNVLYCGWVLYDGLFVCYCMIHSVVLCNYCMLVDCGWLGYDVMLMDCGCGLCSTATDGLWLWAMLYMMMYLCILMYSCKLWLCPMIYDDVLWLHVCKYRTVYSSDGLWLWAMIYDEGLWFCPVLYADGLWLWAMLLFAVVLWLFTMLYWWVGCDIGLILRMDCGCGYDLWSDDVLRLHVCKYSTV